LPVGAKDDKIALIGRLPSGSIEPRRTGLGFISEDIPCSLPGLPRRGLWTVAAGEQHGPSSEFFLRVADPIPVSDPSERITDIIEVT